MITRRCTQRQFLLRPDRAINNAFIYCLAEAAAVHNVDKMAYAHANPAAADLVERASEWPGVMSFDAITKWQCLTATRPGDFFRKNGHMPKTVSLTFARAQGFAHLSDDEYGELVASTLGRREQESSAIRQTIGKKVMGLKAILAQHGQDGPTTREPRRQMSPGIAARSRWARVEALLKRREFLVAYADARAALLAKIGGVFFPMGTWALRGIVAIATGDHSPGALAPPHLTPF
jgi:hypothetical protein